MGEKEYEIGWVEKGWEVLGRIKTWSKYIVQKILNRKEMKKISCDKYMKHKTGNWLHL